uniref:Uncharacterized protein n=1 Tax=Anas platyrhynchos TaxID=8839 RepID=A0A8B9SUQ2_ANAPL
MLLPCEGKGCREPRGLSSHTMGSCFMSWCLWRAVYSLDKRLFFFCGWDLKPEADPAPTSSLPPLSPFSVLGAERDEASNFSSSVPEGTVVPLLEVVAGRPRRLAVQ